MSFKFLYTFLLMLICSQIVAKEFIDSADYQKLKTQIDQQKFSQAWQIAQQHADNYLGDLHFDFLYGLAALNTGHIEHATFAFERVVINKPHWLDGQYYLALSYFKMANYQATIPLCQAIISQLNVSKNLKSSSSKLKQAAQNKLAQQSLSIKHYISLTGGNDSNINAGIDEDNPNIIDGKIFLPFLDQNVLLTPQSQENSDSYLTADYRINVSKPLNQKSKLLFSGQANVHHFIHKSDFNHINLTGSLHYVKQFEYFDGRIGVHTRPLWLAGDYYRNQNSLNVKLKKQLNEQWRISSTLAIGKTNNNINKTLDTDDSSLSVSGSYDLNNWRHSVSASYFKEIATDNISDHISKKSIAYSYNNLWIINSQWLASNTLIWQHKKYQGPHPFYFTKQVDNIWLFAAMLQYKQSTSLSYRFNITVQDKDSNLPLFAYQRTDVALTAVITF